MYNEISFWYAADVVKNHIYFLFNLKLYCPFENVKETDIFCGWLVMSSYTIYCNLINRFSLPKMVMVDHLRGYSLVADLFLQTKNLFHSSNWVCFDRKRIDSCKTKSDEWDSHRNFWSKSAMCDFILKGIWKPSGNNKMCWVELSGKFMCQGEWDNV